MSSLFEDSDSSADERTRSQRSNLNAIRQAALSPTPNPHPPADGPGPPADVGDLLTEEQELQQLRRSTVYQLYAAQSKRKPVAGDADDAGDANEAGVADDANDANDANDAVDADEDDDARDTREPRDAHPSPSPSAVAFDSRAQTSRKSPDAKKNMSFPVSAESHTLTGGTVLPRTTSSKRGDRRIDPKIIEDSSDEDGHDDSEDDSQEVQKSSRLDEDADNSEDEALLGPALPPHALDQPNLDKLPLHNEATLGETHPSFVSCLSLERAGNRLFSASLDSSAKLWDLNAMTRALLPFRSLDAVIAGGAPRCAHFSPSGGHIVVAGGATTATVLDRDGGEVARTAAGDMYIVDMARTNGHVGHVMNATWALDGDGAHTFASSSSSSSAAAAGASARVVYTTGADGTLREWNVGATRRVGGHGARGKSVAVQTRVVKLRTASGGRAIAGALDAVRDASAARLLALGCNDGRLRVMDGRTRSDRPAALSGAFAASAVEVSGVACAVAAAAAPLVAVRTCGDDALRVFDRRKMEKAIGEFGALENNSSETGVVFVGSDSRYLLTGTSERRRGATESSGTLRLFCMRTLRQVWNGESPDGCGGVVSVLWHAGVNQIFYGTSDGSVHVMYHPSESERGVLRCLTRSDYRRRHGVASVGVGEVVSGSFESGKRRRAGAQQANGASDVDGGNVPKKPRATTGEPLRADASTTMAKFLQSKAVQASWSEDPRQALLRYANVADKERVFTKAYDKTQPSTLLAVKTAEEEEEETRKAIYDRDRRRAGKGKK